jgi:outer membrane murein-binding lipoprotein Lpp
MFMNRNRRGKAVAQWVVVAALLTLAIVAGVTLIGTRTNNKMNQTASDVGNPSALTQRFGS